MKYVRVMLRKKKEKKEILYVACCLWRGLRSHVKHDISISQSGQKARFLDDSCRLISLIVRKKLEI